MESRVKIPFKIPKNGSYHSLGLLMYKRRTVLKTLIDSGLRSMKNSVWAHFECTYYELFFLSNPSRKSIY